MARQIFNIGTTANDGTGDTLRAAFTKANANFQEAYTRTPRTFYKNIASVGLTSKMELVPLTTTNLTATASDCTTTGVTFQQRITAPAQYDAVRVLIPNLASTMVTGVKVGLAFPTKSGGWKNGALPAPGGNIASTSLTNPNNDDMSDNVSASIQWTANSGAFLWRAFLFGDMASVEADLPPAHDFSRNIPSWTATDWTPCTPPARTDGGTLPLIDLRIQYPPAGATPLSGAASSSPGVTRTSGNWGNWAIDGSQDTSRNFLKGRMWKAWSEPALGVNSGINFQGSNQPNTTTKSVPIVVQFRCQQEVHTIMYANDSIGEFTSGTGEYANSYALRGALAAAQATGKIVSWCPVTWPSGAIINYGRAAQRLIDLVRPSILWAKPVGPNETTATPLTQKHYNSALQNLSFLLAIGQRYGSRVIIEPHLAVQSSGGYTFGASDSVRVAWNTAFQTQAATRDYIFADLDPAWYTGGAIASGQQQPLPANTSDGVHSSDAGFAALAPAATIAATSALNLE
jgi:hypothetical protein